MYDSLTEMASKAVALTAHTPRDLSLSPLDKVRCFFEALTDMRLATEVGPSPEDNTRYSYIPCSVVLWYMHR